MSVPAVDLKSRLACLARFTTDSTIPNKWKFDLDGTKFYSIRFVENNVYVERDYDADSHCDWLKTIIARMFGRSNRQLIRKIITSQALDLPEEHPLAKYKVRNLASESPQNDSSRPREQRTPFLNVNGNNAATARTAKTENAHLNAPRKLHVEVIPEVIAYTGCAAKRFIDPDGRLPEVREPTRKVSKEQQAGLNGKFKKAVACDDEFIVLRPRKQVGSFAPLTEKLDAVAIALKPFKTCCPNVVVDEQRIIARYGGTDLSEYTRGEGGQPVALDAFQEAVGDLSEMHSQGIYLRDIKPENLTVKDGMVMFIDTDDAAVPSLGNYQQDETTAFAPQFLNEDIYTGRENGDLNALEMGDKYAMLITMIATTTDEPVLNDIGVTSEDEPHPGIPEKTFIDLENEAAVKQWLQKNIKSVYQLRVLSFLRDPIGMPLQQPLHEVIAWQ